MNDDDLKPAQTIEVEAPEVVTIQLVLANGTTHDVLFTRDEYRDLERAAAVSGMSIERWMVKVAVEQVRGDLGLTRANPRGST